MFEEAGRALAPVPLHPHMVASLALAQAIERGGSALAEELISRACLGEVRLTWAWEERLPIMGPEAISLSAVPDGNGWRLNGSKSMVEAFEISNYCLLAVRTDTTGQASEGISLLLVRPDAEGISSTAHRTLAGDEQSMVQFVRTIFHKAG